MGKMMKGLVIRKARSSDNFSQIAKLIYLSDIYIFPYWFSPEEEGVNIIREMVKKENTMFSYKHCIVAEVNGEIVGVINYFDKDSDINNDYSQWNNTKEFDFVLRKHLKPLDKYQKENIVYLAYLSVLPEYRRKNIATQMLQALFKMYENVEFILYCVKDNLPAFNLYKKNGFEYCGDAIGFNGPHMKKPLISKMVMKKD